MKVYLCWQKDDWNDELIGIFLHQKDACDMKEACETEERTYLVEEKDIIE